MSTRIARLNSAFPTVLAQHGITFDPHGLPVFTVRLTKMNGRVMVETAPRHPEVVSVDFSGLNIVLNNNDVVELTISTAKAVVAATINGANVLNLWRNDAATHEIFRRVLNSDAGNAILAAPNELFRTLEALALALNKRLSSELRILDLNLGAQPSQDDVRDPNCFIVPRWVPEINPFAGLAHKILRDMAATARPPAP